MPTLRQSLHKRNHSDRGRLTGLRDPLKVSSQSSASPARHSRPTCKHQGLIEKWTMSYIGYGIYVGNLRAACAEILSDNGITHVLSLLNPGEEPEETLDVFTHKRYDIRDDSKHIKSDLINIVGSAMRFIDEGTSSENKILVHGRRGRSRSVIAVINYLKYRKRFTWFHAFCHVAENRPCIGLHDEFSDFLTEKKEEDKEVDGPENFDFKLDGFLSSGMESVARKNVQDLEKLKEEEKERLKRTGISFDKFVKDSRKDEGVKLTVQISKRADSPIPAVLVQ